MNNIGLEYRGDIDLYIKGKGETKKLCEIHNNGYDPLFKLFSKVLAGASFESAEIPATLDIRYQVGSEYFSCLAQYIDINKKYGFVDDKYITFIEAMIPYSYIKDEVFTSLNSGTAFYLVLLNGNNEIMAMTQIGYNYVSRIQPGTQMVVEWKMYIANPAK